MRRPVTRSGGLAEFDILIDEIGDSVPDASQYRRLSVLHLDVPEISRMRRLDPFSTEYRQAALELYLALRGRPEQGYAAARDERPATPTPQQLWTGLVPWSFRDAALASEHLLAWGRIFRHLTLPTAGSVLEYGPGSGQILLMLARMGYRACGVDIDATALDGIRAQAAHLELPVETEQAGFGLGFGGQRFDRILFYEAFHHALDFDALLIALHDRLNPGGRVLLCGEPIAAIPSGDIPYPWGPRLDGLSVFCIRRFGWMELGFSHDYFVTMARAAGWRVTFDGADIGRAALYVLEPDGTRRDRSAAAAHGSLAWRRNRPGRIARLMLRRARRRAA